VAPTFALQQESILEWISPMDEPLELSGDEIFQCLLDSLMQEEAKKLKLDVVQWQLNNKENNYLDFLDEPFDSSWYHNKYNEGLDSFDNTGFKPAFHVISRDNR